VWTNSWFLGLSVEQIIEVLAAGDAVCDVAESAAEDQANGHL